VALSEARRGLELDPLFADRHLGLGFIRLLAGHYDAAIESLERALELSPRHPFGPALLPSAYHYGGKDAEALEASVRGLPPEIEAALRRGYDAGGYDGMVRVVVELRVAQSGRPCTSDPSYGAHLYALIGESDQMYACIDEALAQQGYWGLSLKAHPDWDPYRDDPRFTALLRRMGLEE
jgi:serine/threonine-protein kinase